jgi:ABC-type uncharacterized transport system permease subunit
MCSVGLLVCFDALYKSALDDLQCVVWQVAISMTAALAWELPCTTLVRQDLCMRVSVHVNLSLTKHEGNSGGQGGAVVYG